MGLMVKFFSQTRKPEGTLGKMMLKGMNSGHAKLADWGFEHLPKLSLKKAADLGCGAGKNAGELLKKYPQANVTAMDYSALSVQKAKEYNQAMIDAGRCRVIQGDISKLPFEADSYGLGSSPVKSMDNIHSKKMKYFMIQQMHFTL
ncbi:class I SAM-dependent methyltransferase [Ruminococcus sp.]|uniref:class I SAM-dependent methyltransferase n=1 Tax=Ruminococcus sp. TaxID=41978 RepID=UPI0025FA723F|nr:class I SAM-dependent methyltransferase [Ruminococcus sp.]